VKIKDITDIFTSRLIHFHFNWTIDELEDRRLSYFTHIILLVTIFLLSILSIIRIIIPPKINLSDYIIWTLVLIVVGIFFLFRKGYVKFAGVLYVITFWLTLTSLAYSFEGVRDIAIVAYILIILIAMLIVKQWQALVTGILSLISIWVIYYLEYKHIFIPKADTTFNYSIEFTVILIFVIVLINLNAKNYSDYYKRFQKELEERNLAQKALCDSEERFKILSSIGSEGLLIHENGIIVEINQAFTDLLGYSSPDELIGKNGLDIIQLTTESKKIVTEQIRKNSHDTYDIELVNLEGKIIPAETKATEIVYKGRKMRLLYMSDITKRKMYEEALIKSKALLNSIIDSTDDLIWSVDTNQYRLLTFNKGMKSILEREGIQIKEGMLHEDIFPPESVNKLYQMYSQTLEKGSFITIFQTVIGNRTLWINLHLLSAEGKPYAISGFAKDITELKNAEEALIKAKEKAEENDRLKTAFMNNISHEIRTPLNGILGFSQLVFQPDITEEERGTYLNVLNLSSERLLNTITNYMDISLIVSKSVKVHKEPFIVSELVNDLYEMFHAKCEAKNLDFIKLIPFGKKDFILNGDASLLKKSLSHLLDNAIKFTLEGGVSLGFDFKNKECELIISDTGSGINQETQERIFDYFIQEEISDTRGYEGSGLGLSIARGLIELMGGKIKLESIKGKGSTFYVIFPSEMDIIRDNDNSNIKNSQHESEILPLILIVDDDELSLYIMRKILGKASLKFLIAKNGLEAVDLCRENTDISIVLMDIKMPLLNGLEATQKIREYRKDILIIGVSAYAKIGDIEKAIDAGFDDYLTKPVNASLLLSTLNRNIQKMKQ
jgi:PAS domain S-box-containing protein